MECLTTFFVSFSSQVCAIAHITAKTMPHEGAECKKGSEPNIRDPPTRELSVVVPSYNEENRCKIFLVLRKRQKSICYYCNKAEVSWVSSRFLRAKLCIRFWTQFLENSPSTLNFKIKALCNLISTAKNSMGHL